MEITLKQLYRDTKTALKEAGIECPENNCIGIMGKHFNVNRQSILLHGDTVIDNNREYERFLCDVKRRLSGEPLQYILGEWEFSDLKFKVGKGVLIPREETVELLDTAIKFLKGKSNAKVVDLCTGSGALAICIAKQIEDSSVWGIELSDDAFSYFLKNASLNKAENVTAIKEDVFKAFNMFEDEFFDAIISNPPYIETDEIPLLQKEVQFEPSMALDGGKDGLDFYKKIISFWTPKLKKGGMLAFELGEGQFDCVSDMLAYAGYLKIGCAKDLSGVKRVIKAIRDKI